MPIPSTGMGTATPVSTRHDKDPVGEFLENTRPPEKEKLRGRLENLPFEIIDGEDFSSKMNAIWSIAVDTNDGENSTTKIQERVRKKSIDLRR